MIEPSVVAACPRCSSDITEADFVALDSGSARYSCRSCGHVQHTEVLIGLEPHTSTRFVVSVRWQSGRASTAELAALRQLTTKYAAMTVADAFSETKEAELTLGIFEDRRARELQERGRALGLDVSIVHDT